MDVGGEQAKLIAEKDLSEVNPEIEIIHYYINTINDMIYLFVI